MNQTPDPAGVRVLVIEDNASYRTLLVRRLGKRGYLVEGVDSGEAAVASLERETPQIAICDISLPGMSGLELLKVLRGLDPKVEAIVLTGQGSVATAIEAMREGAYHYFEKPVPFEELLLYVQGASEKQHLSRQNLDLKRQLARNQERPAAFVGTHESVRRVRELIARVGGTEAPVLIEGETGTGKDLVARAVHAASPRKDSGFVAINCGALSEALLESELFGHVAGAFTGATGEREGVFEVAHGGTLFIDEVGEMSLEIQKKFLRLIENGEYRRLGESRVRRADVRIVAATNRILSEAVAAGEFREDLYYRLNVVSIRTPPLREHPEDLPLLVDELLEQARLRSGRVFEVEPPALTAFAAYAWPGNVRELRNVLERGMVLAPGHTIRLTDCPGVVREGAARASAAPTKAATVAADIDFGDVVRLEDVERIHVLRVLDACGGNKTEAAKRLDVSLRSLYRKLEKFAPKDES
ncbi:MAG: sigma-54-dependent Fis family transcriptional regulator [Planctomycetes bacterium]|nr:sigma-54-dependent Fis family transcriptional regulator [Planctomycetota bacterium]